MMSICSIIQMRASPSRRSYFSYYSLSYKTGLGARSLLIPVPAPIVLRVEFCIWCSFNSTKSGLVFTVYALPTSRLGSTDSLRREPSPAQTPHHWERYIPSASPSNRIRQLTPLIQSLPRGELNG